MINKIGIGLDVADINKFKEIPFKSKSGFYKKLFTESEIKYCLQYKSYSEHFAAKFAIKEAVKKSIPDRVSMLDIETYHVKSKPNVKIKKLQNRYTFRISVSHERNIAVAVVLSERTSRV